MVRAEREPRSRSRRRRKHRSARVAPPTQDVSEPAAAAPCPPAPPTDPAVALRGMVRAERRPRSRSRRRREHRRRRSCEEAQIPGHGRHDGRSDEGRHPGAGRGVEGRVLRGSDEGRAPREAGRAEREPGASRISVATLVTLGQAPGSRSSTQAPSRSPRASTTGCASAARRPRFAAGTRPAGVAGIVAGHMPVRIAGSSATLRTCARSRRWREPLRRWSRTEDSTRPRSGVRAGEGPRPGRCHSFSFIDIYVVV